MLSADEIFMFYASAAALLIGISRICRLGWAYVICAYNGKIQRDSYLYSGPPMIFSISNQSM